MLRRTFGIVAIISGLATSSHALTVGEFRDAYAALHALDPIPQNQRDAYVAAHRNAIDVARTRLEASVMVRDTVLGVNGMLIQRGQRPFLCNYDLEDIDDQVDLYGWVEEFRSEAMEKHKLIASPKTDEMLDAVQFEDVISHKMIEKFPCPASLSTPSQAAQAPAGQMPVASTHQHHAR